MIATIYVQLVIAFVGGYVYRDFWNDLQSHDDGAALWVRFWCLVAMAFVGWALGHAGIVH